MKKLLLLLLVLSPFISLAGRFSPQEIKRYQAEAKRVTIIRDNWGVPHIYGKTDADVVFGLMYAQCEENFKGIERNYMYQMGRQSEVDGDATLYTDVQLQLIADSADAIKDYRTSAPWFRKLMDAFAGGINYYLYKHPEVKPQVFKRFEPWYALMFTDGSVAATMTGGINLAESQSFYADNAHASSPKTGALIPHKNDVEELVQERELGSNGFAIAPSRSASGHALLYINPHVPFYFRSEVELVSDEGLYAYGAVTWGQFFIYQGFNKHCGWMHTSSYADVADLYAEKVTQKGGKWYYQYNGQERSVTERKLKLNVKRGNATKSVVITGYYTHHGPVLGSRAGRWLALRANNRSYNALLESWLITKAGNFAEYKKAMDLLQNATNNTVYADDKGNIAFWYGNFMPKRDPRLDWTQPVDGTTSATEWQGLHPLDEIIHVYNPVTGWIQNCNSTPYACSGAASPDKTKYPAYMGPDGENYRGINAVRLLKNAGKLSLDELTSKGYDHYLAAFDVLLPALFKAYEKAPDSLQRVIAEPVRMLREWDRRSAIKSVATALAVDWGTRMLMNLPRAKSAEENTYQTQRVTAMLRKMTDLEITGLLQQSVNNMTANYGTWKIEWGDINRYQRPPHGVFNDDEMSLPVGQTSSNFGQLPSFVSRTMNTKKRYGYSGNSFIAAVEFGPRIKAKSIITGGQSFDPDSRHFTDQAQMYIDGQFKDVLFYKEDVLRHVERTYHPGE